jgi:hypothetical protein
MLTTFLALLSLNLAAPLALGAQSMSAEATVTRFYKSYLGYLASVAGKERSVKTANEQTAAVTRLFLTPRFQAEQDKLMKYCSAPHADVPEECDGDPLTCAQEPPSAVKILGSDASSVTVELDFNGQKRKVTLTVRKVNARWRIDGVSC